MVPPLDEAVNGCLHIYLAIRHNPRQSILTGPRCAMALWQAASICTAQTYQFLFCFSCIFALHGWINKLSHALVRCLWMSWLLEFKLKEMSYHPAARKRERFALEWNDWKTAKACAEVCVCVCVCLYLWKKHNTIDSSLYNFNWSCRGRRVWSLARGKLRFLWHWTEANLY